ncbi:hypothetical protein HAX54_035663 [Datura stramonium]|uniref:Uncharacterized protein n=1 Tax=Datura stramonium TaxID=4076 RepID=A0ABS8VGS6_DATST|nr:hypothetical protein [Datura stramonium]
MPLWASGGLMYFVETLATKVLVHYRLQRHRRTQRQLSHFPIRRQSAHGGTPALHGAPLLTSSASTSYVPLRPSTPIHRFYRQPPGGSGLGRVRRNFVLTIALTHPPAGSTASPASPLTRRADADGALLITSLPAAGGKPPRLYRRHSATTPVH